SSSSAITSSTISSESAPRSSRKDDSFLISASFTPSCSATIFLTRCSMLSMQISKWGKIPANYSQIKKKNGNSQDKKLASPNNRPGPQYEQNVLNPSDLRQKIDFTPGKDVLRSKLHIHAAVYMQGGARHVSGFRAGQKSNGISNV